MDTDGSTVLRRIVLESDRQATSSSFLRATVYLDLHLPAVFRLPSAHQGKASAKRLFRSCSRSSLTSLTFQLWSFRNSAFSKRRRVVKVHHRHEHLIHQSVVFLETGYLSYQFGLTKSVASPGVWEGARGVTRQECQPHLSCKSRYIKPTLLQLPRQSALGVGREPGDARSGLGWARSLVERWAALLGSTGGDGNRARHGLCSGPVDIR